MPTKNTYNAEYVRFTEAGVDGFMVDDVSFMDQIGNHEQIAANIESHCKKYFINILTIFIPKMKLGYIFRTFCIALW